MFVIEKLLKMNKTLTIRIYGSAGVVRMRYHGHDMSGGKVQHIARCWFRLVKGNHTLECNPAITLGSLYSERAETFTLLYSLYFVENVLIVLGRVDEIAMHGVELES